MATVDGDLHDRAADVVAKRRAAIPQHALGLRAGQPLTARERQVLGYVAEGLGEREISYVLSVGLETAKSHVRNLREKLRARNKAHAVALAMEAGLLGRSALSEATDCCEASAIPSPVQLTQAIRSRGHGDTNWCRPATETTTPPTDAGLPPERRPAKPSELVTRLGNHDARLHARRARAYLLEPTNLGKHLHTGDTLLHPKQTLKVRLLIEELESWVRCLQAAPKRALDSP